VVYYLLGYTLYAILMAGAGALGTTMRESQQLAGVFSFFAAVPYMISGFLFANPNMAIARALSFFPLTAPTMMMLRLPLAEVPWVDVVGSIVVLLLSVPAALWVGAKLFRVGLLIYGKRPTLREIWLILRGNP
jgi:ABC-2 type transport system permease protein